VYYKLYVGQGCAARKKVRGRSAMGKKEDHTTFSGSQFFERALQNKWQILT